MINFLISFIDLPNKFKILKFLKDEFKRKKINVIDIGAHKGETINFFLKNFLVNKLIAFEPNRILFELLQKKFDDDRISIFNFGVGFKKEKKTLNVFIDSASSTFNKINTKTKYFKRKLKYLFLDSKKGYFLEPQEIEIINLSEFLLKNEENIDILKIDTEGFEYNILKGISNNDFKKIKFIYFEHHYDLMIEKEYKFHDINNLLKKNNFIQLFKIKMKFRKSFEYIYGQKEKNIS